MTPSGKSRGKISHARHRAPIINQFSRRCCGALIKGEARYSSFATPRITNARKLAARSKSFFNIFFCLKKTFFSQRQNLDQAFSSGTGGSIIWWKIFRKRPSAGQRATPRRSIELCVKKITALTEKMARAASIYSTTLGCVAMDKRE